MRHNVVSLMSYVRVLHGVHHVPQAPVAWLCLWPVLQLFAVLVNEYGIHYPYIVRTVTSSLSFTNFDVFSFVRFGCKSAEMDQFGHLQLMTAVPAGLLLVLAVLIALLSTSASDAALPLATRHRLRSWLRTLAMVVMFLVLPAVSAEIVKSVRCDAFDDGSRYLTVDYRIK